MGGDIPTGTPQWGRRCRWGIGRNRDSDLIAGYRRLLDVRTTNWQKQLPTTMQCRSHSRRRTSECSFVTACSMDEYAVVYLKPKQLIIKDCARRFVLKLYRHEASRGLSAIAELLVHLSITFNWSRVTVFAHIIMQMNYDLWIIMHHESVKNRYWLMKLLKQESWFLEFTTTTWNHQMYT